MAPFLYTVSLHLAAEVHVSHVALGVPVNWWRFVEVLNMIRAVETWYGPYTTAKLIVWFHGLDSYDKRWITRWKQMIPWEYWTCFHRFCQGQILWYIMYEYKWLTQQWISHFGTVYTTHFWFNCEWFLKHVLLQSIERAKDALHAPGDERWGSWSWTPGCKAIWKTVRLEAILYMRPYESIWLSERTPVLHSSSALPSL